jgi:hypothetical protein
MNRIFKSVAKLFGYKTSTSRGRPAGSGKRTSGPAVLRFSQGPDGRLTRLGAGRPKAGTVVVRKTQAEADAVNASLTTPVSTVTSA